MAATVATRLDRYIFRQLAIALLSVTAGLTALIWLTQSLRLIELVVNRGLSFGTFLKLTGLLIPNFVAVILPICTFVVVQFVYQRLSGDRELTVMRAAGLSPWALSRPALTLVALVTVLGYVLNLWLVPLSYRAFRDYQYEIRNRLAAFLLQDGVFTTISQDLTVYIRSRDPDDTLHGIFVEDARQKNSRATILAQSGQLVQGPDGPRVILRNGSRQQIDRASGRLNILAFKENTIDLATSQRSDNIRIRDAAEMDTSELLNPPPDVLARDVGKLKVEAHRRLSSPLTTFSFAMVALVSVLTGAFRRHGNILRPLVAILTVVGLVALGLAISNLAAKSLGIVPLIYLEALLPGMICAGQLYMPGSRFARRFRRRRRARLRPA